MMIQSRISNIPFLDGANDMFTTTNKSHFKPFDNTAIQKRNVILRPVSTLLQRGDNNYQRKHQTETASSFTSHPRTPVTLPTMTHRTMQRTNFKMHSEKRCGDFETNVTHADFKPLPMSAAKIIRPTTSVRISLPGSKFPETTHRSSYTKHEVSSDRRAKETVNTGTHCTPKCDCALILSQSIDFCILWVDIRCFLFINKVSGQLWKRTKRMNSVPVIMSSSFSFSKGFRFHL